MTTQKCARCGSTYRSHMGSPGGYCTSRCRLAAEKAAKPAPPSHCKTCDGAIPDPSHLPTARRLPTPPHGFCSWDCAGMDGGRNPWVVLARDEFRCVYCGKSSIEDGVRLSADHIVARSKGGSDRLLNLVTACQSCNSAKGAKTLAPDVEARLLALAAERTTEDLWVRLRSEGR